MQDCFAFADELGPAKIIHVYEPSIELRAILVVDNVAMGPSIGGVRMAPDVSLEECVRLARAMTLKNAAAGLPHGGGKVVIFGDPKMQKPEKERLIRGLAQALRNVEEYIFAPDMGTDEACMAWVRDEIGRVIDYPEGERFERDALIGVRCDIWIPAARPDVIREDNVDRLRARLVIQGANIPVTLEAERILHERGVLCVPDFIANAGGVICAAMEYKGATELAAMQSIQEKLRHNTRLVLDDSRRRGILPRQAAEELALARLHKAMDLRRFNLFSTAPEWI